MKARLPYGMKWHTGVPPGRVCSTSNNGRAGFQPEVSRWQNASMFVHHRLPAAAERDYPIGDTWHWNTAYGNASLWQDAYWSPTSGGRPPRRRTAGAAGRRWRAPTPPPIRRRRAFPWRSARWPRATSCRTSPCRRSAAPGTCSGCPSPGLPRRNLPRCCRWRGRRPGLRRGLSLRRRAGGWLTPTLPVGRRASWCCPDAAAPGGRRCPSRPPSSHCN
jgi:hypothetical protein